MSTPSGSRSHWICRPSNIARICDATVSGSRSASTRPSRCSSASRSDEDAPALAVAREEPVVGGVVVVDALGREDREEAHDARPLLVLAAQREQDVEDVRVRGAGLRDALVVVLVAQLEQLEQQLLLGGEVVQQPRLAHPDALGDGRQRRAAEARASRRPRWPRRGSRRAARAPSRTRPAPGPWCSRRRSLAAWARGLSDGRGGPARSSRSRAGRATSCRPTACSGRRRRPGGARPRRSRPGRRGRGGRRRPRC